jgi:hypothetical protein
MGGLGARREEHGRPSRRGARLLAGGLLILLLAGCMPAYPKPAPGPRWNRHTIARGAHNATVTEGATAPEPLLGLTRRSGRAYTLIFDASARYRITQPTQPDDQLDWNKLPGLSDCNDVDLAENGLMFGWRWNLAETPKVLELTAYANNHGTHLWSDAPLLSLTRAQVDARRPIWFRLRISNDRRSYEFTIRTVLAGEEEIRHDRLPRACPTVPRDKWKWAGGFYFGGTSVAPQRIQAHVHEPR